MSKRPRPATDAGTYSCTFYRSWPWGFCGCAQSAEAAAAAIYLAYLSKADCARVERSTTAATDKFSFGYAPFIVAVPEGVLQRYGPLRLFKEQRERLGFELRATTLGHVQRVGSTGASDRLLAVSLDGGPSVARSEEHTSELQSRFDLVCRLLLEKKKKDPSASSLTQNKKEQHQTI